MSTQKRRRPAWQAHDGSAVEQANTYDTIVSRAPASAGTSALGAPHGDPTHSATGAPKLLYSIGEAAYLLSISRAHLYRLLERGELRSVPVGSGRCRRITRAALEAYVAHLEVGGAR